MLNLHLVRLFAAVAEHGSFSRAAESLGVTQPAVSRGVGALEDEIGMPLVERGARGARLTEAGRALHAHARVILNAERAAEAELGELRGLRGGTLHVGASTTIATYVLPRVVAAYRRTHPGVRLRVTSANTQDILALLLERGVDVALVEGPIANPHVEITPWGDDELVVIAGKHHPLSALDPVPARELTRQLFIVREAGSGTREVLERTLRVRRIRLGRTLEVGSTEAIKQTVAAGLGISVVSRAAAADQLALGKLALLRVRGFPVRRTFNRIALRGHRPSAAARAFEAMLAVPGS